jgi:hypothetical protein
VRLEGQVQWLVPFEFFAGPLKQSMIDASFVDKALQVAIGGEIVRRSLALRLDDSIYAFERERELPTLSVKTTAAFYAASRCCPAPCNPLPP